ncbi:MAG: hypothetical protein PHR69_09680 [Sphaerochaeta sp.]|nr:hypothetical protein [Sphaerochaeta sp.]
MMRSIIGIDVSQKSSSFHLIGTGNKEGIDGSFFMDREGFESLLAQAGCTNTSRFVMESTGLPHHPGSLSLAERAPDVYR